MWIFLSKKIAIPNGVKLKSISWNTEEGWIACGGEQGLLKVLKLETTEETSYKGIAAPTSLTMNQTLEGHKGRTNVVGWNENFRKLTSSDDNGLIIVWLLHKGMWFEEMINNRNQSVVRDLKWTSDGEKICIVYEDGAVIVGSVDGNRLWGKELKTALSHVEWSPDGKYILFGTLQGQVKIYDAKNGMPTCDVKIACLEDESLSHSLAGIDWYDGSEGYSDINSPALAICYENGRCQLMRTELDENPILVDTEMRVSKIKWNCQGTVLAICGAQDTGEDKVISVVQFYNPYGIHLKTLKIPGSGVAGISWEGTGLRLALAVDSYVFFANVRPDYKWGWFNKNTLVYSFTKLDRPEHCVVFWNSKTDDKFVKYIKRLVAIRAVGENCILVTKADQMQQTPDKKYILIICNSIGSPIETKYLSIEPLHIVMTPSHVIVASESNVYVWQHRRKQGVGLSSDIKRDENEFFFHIDDNVARSFKGKFKESDTSDSICAICATEKHLLVARESGTVYQYAISGLTLVDRFVLKCRPQVLAINCDSSRLSVIDINSVFSLYKLNTSSDKKSRMMTNEIEQLDLERKEVWDMIWSEDNPELFAIMEKTKLYTFRNTLPEEPKPSSAFLCGFNNLKIKGVLLDEIMIDPERPNKENIQSYETRSLRDTKKIISSVSLEDAFVFVKDNPHPRLYKLLAEAALQKQEYDIAHRAFINSGDFQGVQFVKKLREFKDRLKQQAEIATYFKNFDEAERIYKQIDRKDLAIELRKEVGDWFGVLQLLKEGGGNDEMKKETYNQIGDYFVDRHMWSRALQHYIKSENYERLVQVYYKKEDFKSLEKLVNVLPESSPLLFDIGDKFSAAGIAQSAVRAFLKGGDVRKAIDTCVSLNLWDKAVELAEQNNMKDVEEILFRYATVLVEKGMIPEAIELYQKANRNTESAKLLTRLAQEAANVKLQPLKAKMLFVFAALDIEQVKRRLLDTEGANTKLALKGLMEHEMTIGYDKTLDNAWKGAEAYHFLMLCQRQLGQEKYEDALNTALRLIQYEDILNRKDMYSLIALATFYAEDYKHCSKAFVKLESYEDSRLTAEEQSKYRTQIQALAIEIFTMHPPVNGTKLEPKGTCEKCGHSAFEYENRCSRCHTPFYACVATGRNIFNAPAWTCPACKHRVLEHALYKTHNCPLCHTLIEE